MQKAVAVDDVQSLVRIAEQVNEISFALKKLSKPVIMVVDGPCAGAAANLAVAADFTIASVKAKFIQAFVITPEGSSDAHAATCGLLALLEESGPPPPLLPQLFRLRLASGQGFATQLDNCQVCGRPADNLPRWTFNPGRGGIACPACQADNGQQLPLSAPALQILRRASFDCPQTWRDFELAPSLRHECGEAVDAFIHYHVGVVWEKNGFQRV